LKSRSGYILGCHAARSGWPVPFRTDRQPGALDLTYDGCIRSEDTGSVSDSKWAVGSISNGLTMNPNPRPPEIHQRQARAATALRQRTERVQEGQGAWRDYLRVPDDEAESMAR
jgi:hypothetical protein